MPKELAPQWKYVIKRLKYAHFLLQEYPSGATLADLIVALEDAESELIGLDPKSLDPNKRKKVSRLEEQYRNRVNQIRLKYRNHFSATMAQFLMECGTNYRYPTQPKR